MTRPQAYQIESSPVQWSDLQARLRAARWPDEVENDDWRYGTNMTYLQDLVNYWANHYDWPRQQAWLNNFDHYRCQVQGLGLHFIHARSGRSDALPLLLLHGWPSSFVQMLRLIPLLTEPEAHGLDGPAFHVVVASLPGYGFSDAPSRPGMAMEGIADLMHTLMVEHLGYGRYAARGSDLGGTVVDQLARHYPDSLLGIHLSGLIVAGGAPAPQDASQAEKDFLQASAAMAINELGYARMHASKPQTLAYALNDSPVGLAAWMVEKFRAWGDTGGDMGRRFSHYFLITNLMTYWLSNNVNASMRLYYEMVRNRGSQAFIQVPTGMLMSRRDLFPPAPKEWAQRSHHIVHWTETDTGGHFLEWEEPTLVASELQKFFRKIL